MRNYLSRFFKASKGFTLIELLVVIGILGVLAAALIATIDPFEQIKKANDTNSQNTTVEFVTANIRYYTNHSILPWGDTSGAGGYAGCGSSATSLSGGSGSTCIKGLIADGELKTAFSNASTVLKTISYLGSATSVTACYKPLSKSGQLNPNTIYSDSSGGTGGNASCKSLTSNPALGTDCYWCTQ